LYELLGWSGERSPPSRSPATVRRRRGGRTTVGPGGAPTFWAGSSGVFNDPDGHRWEFADNPGWSLADDDSVRLP